jgi:hypothetical protein
VKINEIFIIILIYGVSDISSGRIYWINHVTKETSWNRPAPSQQKLPPGWESGVDPGSGRIYFVNHATQTTHWEIPQSLIQGNIAGIGIGMLHASFSFRANRQDGSITFTGASTPHNTSPTVHHVESRPTANDYLPSGATVDLQLAVQFGEMHPNGPSIQKFHPSARFRCFCVTAEPNGHGQHSSPH